MKFNLHTVVVIAVFHFGLVNEVSLLFGRQRWPVTVGFGNEGCIIPNPSPRFFCASFLTVYEALIPKRKERERLTR
jgi:hypothetical protein